MPKITSCICTDCSYDYLERSIDNLINQDIPSKDYNIFIQDNSGRGGLSDKIRNKYKNISNLTYNNQYASGLSQSRNICVDHCQTDYIHFLDDDAIPHKSMLKNAILCFENKSCDAIGGKTVADWGDEEKPSWFSPKCAGLLSMLDFGTRTIELKQHEHWIVGANMAFKTSCIESFNENLGRSSSSNSLLSNEEALVTKKIWEDGGKIFYSPKMLVWHKVRKERLNQQWFIKRVVWQAISDYLSDIAQWNTGKSFKSQTLSSILKIFNKEISSRQDCETAEEFEEKLNQIFNLTRLLIKGL